MKDLIGYNYTIDTSMMDKFGGLTPCGYQRIIMTVTEKELKRLEMDIPTMIKNYGISWILLSLTVKVKKPFYNGQNLVVKTRHTWQKGVLYRRDFAIYNEDGDVCALAVTFSSLFDIAKRHITMDKEIYKKITLPEEDELFDANPKCNFKGDFVELEEVEVRPCWIDALGHVNNFRYGELTFDSLPENYQHKLKDLKRMEIFFTGELRLKEKVVLKRCEENGILHISGIHKDNLKQAFLTNLYF